MSGMGKTRKTLRVRGVSKDVCKGLAAVEPSDKIHAISSQLVRNVLLHPLQVGSVSTLQLFYSLANDNIFNVYSR